MSKSSITLINLFRSSRAETVLPLGCLWLRAALERHGHEVDIRDLQFLSGDVYGNPDAVVEHLGETHGVIGISVMADSLPLAVAVAKRMKQLRPDRVIILGGWGPTAVADALISAFPWIDFVVRGEGEETIVELLAAIGTDQIDQVAGVSGRKGGLPFRAADRASVRDVAALAEPDYRDIDFGDYSYYTTVTARGCPYTCQFCEIPGMESRRVRNRSVEAVVAELTAVHREHGVDFVGFQDDIFLLSKPRVDAIMSGLAKEGVSIRWAGFARAGRVEGDWFSRLADQGMDNVTFGIEAASDRLLGEIAKKLTIEKAFSGIQRAVQSVKVRCFFLWGFPQESLVDFFGTVQGVFHAEQLGAVVEVGQVVPLPGSPLFVNYSEPVEFHEEYPFCRIMYPPTNPELRTLVIEHPEIFTAFYSFATPAREDKWQMAAQLCCRN